MIEDHHILQVNATMIAGLLILLTVSIISNATTDSSYIIFANRIDTAIAHIQAQQQQLNGLEAGITSKAAQNLIEEEKQENEDFISTLELQKSTLGLQSAAYENADRIVIGSATLAPVSLFAISSILAVLDIQKWLVHGFMILGFIITIITMLYLFSFYPQIQLQRVTNSVTNLSHIIGTQLHQLNLRQNQTFLELNKTSFK